MQQSRIPHILLLGVLWLALVLVSLGSRTLAPVDETRYASVAWEMWTSGELLVPHLNGVAYSHKPPLLFWLIIAGWRIVGANDWWPRLLPAIFVAGSLPLTSWLARSLWPSEKRTTLLAPWILFGSLLTACCCSVLMFESMVLFFALLALAGLRLAASGRGSVGWLLFAAAIGLGTLSKGPVILLHVLPVALLFPLWTAAGSGPARSTWYAALAGSLLGGSAIALSWALPAAAAGGEAYGRAIFWSQSAGRVLESFAHSRPVWWYLPWLLVILFPWTVWPALLRALPRLIRTRPDPGTSFCLCWLLPTFLLFSAVSGKQPYYLLPLLPGAALLSDRAFDRDPRHPARWHRAPIALVFLALGSFFLFLSFSAHLPWLPVWTAELPAWAGGSFIVLGALLLFAPAAGPPNEVRLLACSTTLLLMVLYLGPVPLAMPRYDVRPIAGLIRAAQDEGRPVAHVGHYEGQFQFPGRLRKPIEVIEPGNLVRWAASHPSGLVISYSRGPKPPRKGVPEWSQPYRGRSVFLWSAEAILTGGSAE